MSQPLVVTVENNNRELAKIYFHWSNSTESALDETKKIINALENCESKNDKDIQLALIRFCENNGGGIDRENDCREHTYIQKIYPDETFLTEEYCSVYGLIAISECGMSDLQTQSLGDVYINIDSETVDFCAYYGYEGISEYNEIKKSCEWIEDFEELKSLEEVPEIGYSLGYFTFEEIDEIIPALNKISLLDECKYEETFLVRHENEVMEVYR